MKSFGPFAIFLCTSILFFSVAKGESNSNSIRVVFQDGAEVTVSDWTFSYKFGESDDPPAGFSIFNYTFANSKMLFLDLGTKKSHGFTTKLKRKISPEEIKIIKFSWGQTKKIGNWSEMQKASIHLKKGEIIEIDGRIKPECSYVSEKEHIFGSGDCPCIYLKGIGLLNGQTGNFEIPLNNSKYHNASERFVEIHFAP